MEENNEHDRFAVATLKDGQIVGHVPREKSKIFLLVQLTFIYQPATLEALKYPSFDP